MDEDFRAERHVEPQAETEAETRAEQQIEDKTADSAATALATGLTLLTAGLGVFGGLTGTVARMARNHETATGIAVGLVLASVVLALASRLVRSSTNTPLGPAYRVYLWAALFCFVAGLGIAMWKLNDSIGEDDRPMIAATMTRADDGSVTISGTAQAGGLKADEQVYVYVISSTFDGGIRNQKQVYFSVAGPDQDGLVDHTFSVILDADVREVMVTVASEEVKETCPLPGADEVTSPSDPMIEPVTPPSDLTACALIAIGKAPPG